MRVKRAYALAAILVAVLSWFFLWPLAEPIITQYVPLAGKTDISAIEVGQSPGGKWMATISYFYTGRPENAYLSVRLLGDPNEANGQINNQMNSLTRAVRGSHRVTIEISRPLLEQEVKAKKVIAELISRPQGEVGASRGVARDVYWPDRSTWDIDNEIATKSLDEVLKRAIALTDAGDTVSLIKARAVVRRLIAKDSKFQPAIDETVRIASKAIWERENVARLSTADEVLKAVRVLVNASAFEELDELATNLRETKARTSSGYPALLFFHRAIVQGLDEPAMTPATWEANESYARKWIKARPESSTAHLLVADIFSNRAWQIRGGGYANSVTESQWKGFKEFSSKAQAYLSQCYEICSKDPKWYSLMLESMRSSSAPSEVYFRTFVEGFERFPEYDPIYGEVAAHLAPKWGGSVETFEAFARQVTSKFSPDTRDSVYARIYSDFAGLKSGAVRPRFSEWQVDCPRLIRGHDYIVAKYPTNYNFNIAAHMAAQCQDKKATRIFMAKVGNAPDLHLWGDSVEDATNAYARAAALAK